ncbi:MAG: hypothetical protein BGO97_11755 [Micrococcales bacterium 70-64]|nr:MAG: hypothetical protein ABT06_11755 [Leifsonia sp. SCN 70-46]OJX86332.1 MAG: hypothetical protein BGO97_11755 [Micrococcales bacterium 70-64]
MFGGQRSMMSSTPKVRTRLATIALFLTVLVCLTGCGPTPFIAVSQVDGNLVFIDCDAIYASEVKIREGQVGGKPADRERVWLATSDTPVMVETVEYGVAPDGMTTTLGPVELSLPATIEISIIRRENGSNVESRRAVFDTSKIPSDGWLMASGKVEAVACP